MLDHDTLTELWERGIITDHASEYGEPNYTNEHPGAPILSGYWWCNCTGDLHTQEVHYPGLADHDLLWDDEWVTVGDKCYRTQPDSYGWQPTAILLPDGCEYVVPAEEGLPAMIEALDAIGNPRTALFARWFSPADLTDDGWTVYAPDDPHTYETGWHPHQTDDPAQVLDLIRHSLPDHETVFYISGTGQFDLRWQAWTRPRA